MSQAAPPRGASLSVRVLIFVFCVSEGFGGLPGITPAGGVGGQRAVQARANGARRRGLLCRFRGIQEVKKPPDVSVVLVRM